MKIVSKAIGLGALALATAAMLGAPSFAVAEETALCKAEESICSAGNTITHVHETSVGKAKLLSSLPTIECNVLFLGDALKGGMGAPLVIHGAFAYLSCNNFCSVSEVTDTESKVEVLRTGTELASVTGEGEVHVSCPFINCTYNGEGLEGHALGPLLVGSGNGQVKLEEQETKIVSGSCPEHAFLDLTTTPLVATYISKESKGSLAEEEIPEGTAALCANDEAKATCANLISHTHFADGTTKIDKGEKETLLFTPGGTFLTNQGNISCYILLLSDVTSSGYLGSPLLIHGQFTFANCNEGKCKVWEINGPAVIELLKTGAELATVVLESEIQVECKAMHIECVYSALGPGGHVLGGLRAGGEIPLPHITFSKQEVQPVEGECPEETTLDTLLKSLAAFYISA